MVRKYRKFLRSITKIAIKYENIVPYGGVFLCDERIGTIAESRKLKNLNCDFLFYNSALNFTPF